MFRDTIEKTADNTFNVRDEYKSKSVDELKEVCRKEALPFSVCAVSVEGDLNVGMMARTASLLGAEKFYIFGRRKFDRRSLVGAQNYLPIVRVEGLDKEGNVSLDKFVAFCNHEMLEPILVEQGGEDVRYFDWGKHLRFSVNIGRKLCLVFGNESTGFPKNFLGFPMVSISQRGVLRSYNVAAAASIVMWELTQYWAR